MNQRENVPIRDVDDGSRASWLFRVCLSLDEASRTNNDVSDVAKVDGTLNTTNEGNATNAHPFVDGHCVRQRVVVSRTVNDSTQRQRGGTYRRLSNCCSVSHRAVRSS